VSKFKCENDGFYPLSNFEKCPRCGSVSYHEVVDKLEEIEKLEKEMKEK